MSKQKDSNKHSAKKVENPPAAPAKPAAPAPARPVEATKPAAPAPAPAKAVEAANPAAPAPVPAPAKPVEATKPVAPTPAPAAAKPVEAAKPAAPATKPAAPAKPAEAAKPAAKAEKPAAAKAAKPASSAKPSAIVTTIVAKFDVGHGNTMHIRGENAGLSWDAGAPMVNAGRDVWVWTTDQIAEGIVVFKLLINDEVWSEGENLSASAGETTTLTPTF